MYGLLDNINWVEEDDFDVLENGIKVWNGSLPYSEGDVFPTDDIKNRACISKTNKMIYNNDIDEIFNDIISIFPEIDPMYGWQIREIVTSLPYFKNCTNSWVGLVAGDSPLIDIDSDSDGLENRLSDVVENSNFATIFQDEVRSRFLDTISAYRVDLDIKNRPVIRKIDTKNFEVFVNKYNPSDIEVVLVFSIYRRDGSEYVDFIEYHYNGNIHKTTFEYNNGTLGSLLSTDDELAFNGLYDESPVVVFKHNVSGNEIYGTDQYRYWSPSMLAGMREFQNLMRLGERTREMIRKVPSSAIKKDSVTGGSVFYNKGTVSYEDHGDGSSPDMAYIVPDVPIDKIKSALEVCIKQIGIDTQLGSVFFNLDTLGSRLSGDSIRAALYPARLEAKRITSEMKDSIKELIIKLGLLAGVKVSKSKLSIEFYDGFPRDELEDIKKVQMRLESSCPSITLENAIMKLDRVPLRVAKQRALDIKNGILDIKNDNIKKEKTNIDTDVTDNIKNDVIEKINLGTSNDNVSKSTSYKKDDTLWDNQLAVKPSDITVRDGGDIT